MSGQNMRKLPFFNLFPHHNNNKKKEWLNKIKNELVLPLPRCLYIKAWENIICPQRNMQPQPVSVVGPVPPV